jgi:hypothetical protein
MGNVKSIDYEEKKELYDALLCRPNSYSGTTPIVWFEHRMKWPLITKISLIPKLRIDEKCIITIIFHPQYIHSCYKRIFRTSILYRSS